MSERPTHENSTGAAKSAGIGLVMGAAVGIVFCGAFETTGVTMIFGAMIGLSLGATIDSRRKKEP